MADDKVAKKKALADAKAAAATAALAWLTGGYDSFIPYLLIHVLAIYMLRYRYEIHTIFAMFTAYSWIRLVRKESITPQVSKLGKKI
jgi:hypothetical protein